MLDVAAAAAKAVAERRTVSGLHCPKCLGGQKREASLSVFPKKGSVLVAVAHCWRSKCGYNKEIVTAGARAQEQDEPAPLRLLPRTKPLTAKAKAYLLERFRLKAETLSRWNVSQHAELSSIFLPAYDWRGREIGGVLRHLGRHHGPKSLSYQHGEPWCCFYLSKDAGRVVLVEDQLSALRAWQLGVTAVALIGVALSEDKLRAVGRLSPKRITLALDADATRRSLRYAQAFGVEVVRLWRDFKDSTDKDIAACLNLRPTY